MLRQAFTDRLKQAMKARDVRTVSTVRLILAALKERDVAARSESKAEELADPDIARMMQGMIKQRRDAIILYEQGNRADLAQQEREEIAVIESFLPQQMSDDGITSAAQSVITATGAAGIRDMGKVMAALRDRHAGSMDFGRAGPIVKRLLG